MIEYFIIKNYLGESVKITLAEGDPEHGMIISKVEGLGPPKANLGMTDLATIDGSIWNSSRVEKRNITIKMIFAYANTIEETRQRTYKYFPVGKELELIVKTDNRFVYTKGVIETNQPDIFSKEEGNNISLVCGDPFFYSKQTQVTVFFGIQPLFEFAFSNESLTEKKIEFGSIERSKEKAIYYDGEREAGVTISIHALANVGDIIIYNTGTRERMDISAERIKEITGASLGAGDDIIITTMRNNKRIRLRRKGRLTNIFNALSRESSWFTLAKGNNIFAYEASYGAESVIIKIEHQIVYEGV